MKIKSVTLLALFAIGFSISHETRPAAATFSSIVNAPSGQLITTTFERSTECFTPKLTENVSFKGGATTGEEITVKLDLKSNTYEIIVDASLSAERQGTIRSGDLTTDAGCGFILSGTKPAHMVINAMGVLVGEYDDGNHDNALPAAMIAFKDTSDRLEDLAGKWSFSGRNISNGVAPFYYETTIDTHGRVRTCEKIHLTTGINCRKSGRLSAHDHAFKGVEPENKNTSLILGKVGSNYVPVLLHRDHEGSGPHFLISRTLGMVGLPPNAAKLGT